MKINLYDFDKTIYAGDSSTDFFFYSLMKYPKIWFIIPKIIASAIKYKFGIITKTAMKETIFSFVRYVPNMQEHIASFWNSHRFYIKEFYQEKPHDKDIIISASPEFLLAPIARDLKVMKLIGSRVNIKTGKFTGLNCHGEEKVKRLNKEIQNYEVLSSYSDSLSDIPILKLAKKQYLVKGNNLKKVKY